MITNMEGAIMLSYCTTMFDYSVEDPVCRLCHLGGWQGSIHESAELLGMDGYQATHPTEPTRGACGWSQT